MSGKGKSK